MGNSRQRAAEILKCRVGAGGVPVSHVAFYTQWWVIFICSSERSLMTTCHRHLQWLFIIPQRLYLWMPRFFQIKVHENCTFGCHKGQRKSCWRSACTHSSLFLGVVSIQFGVHVISLTGRDEYRKTKILLLIHSSDLVFYIHTHKAHWRWFLLGVVVKRNIGMHCTYIALEPCLHSDWKVKEKDPH